MNSRTNEVTFDLPGEFAIDGPNRGAADPPHAGAVSHRVFRGRIDHRYRLFRYRTDDVGRLLRLAAHDRPGPRALAAIAGLIDFFGNRLIRAQGPAWPHMIGNVILLVLATFDVLVHARDAWTSVVPTGIDPVRDHRTDYAHHGLAGLDDGLSARRWGEEVMSKETNAARMSAWTVLSVWLHALFVRMRRTGGRSEGRDRSESGASCAAAVPVPADAYRARFGWNKNETPTVPQGFEIHALATGLEHPRSLYVLPNGDVLAVEMKAPSEHSVKRPKDIIMSWIDPFPHRAETPVKATESRCCATPMATACLKFAACSSTI